MLRLRTAGVTAVLALALTGSAAYAQAPAPAAPEYQNLLTTLLIDNKTVLGQPLAYPASELMITAAIVTIPPGGETGWHFHEVPLFVYIMSGEVTVDYGSEGTRTFEAGASFMEAFEWAHNATNTGSEPVQLMSRYWRIVDGRGRLHEVRGDGVVGEQPMLEPGERFEYTSGTPLATPTGIMAGTYQMLGADGLWFDVEIPAFSLDAPGSRGSVN